MDEFPKLSEQLIAEGVKGYYQFISDDLTVKTKEKQMFDYLGKQIRKQQHFTIKQLAEILHWRRPTLPAHYKNNDPERIKIISRHAFNIDDEEIRTHILTMIHGVAIPSASKILNITFPTKYPTINPMNWKVLSKWKYLDKRYSISINSWMNYLKSCRILMDRFDITGRQLDQALIAIYLKYGLDINLQNFVPLDQFF